MPVNFLFQVRFVSFDIELVKLSARTKAADSLMLSMFADCSNLFDIVHETGNGFVRDSIV